MQERARAGGAAAGFEFFSSTRSRLSVGRFRVLFFLIPLSSLRDPCRRIFFSKLICWIKELVFLNKMQFS